MGKTKASQRVTSTELIQRAMAVFARGFSFTRSITHPYLAERVGPVWVVRDGPRRHGDYRREEWAAHAVEPADVDRIARQHTRGRFAVCALAATGQSDAPLRSGYKALGYRLGGTEAVMVHHLARVPRVVAAKAGPAAKPAVIWRRRPAGGRFCRSICAKTRRCGNTWP